MKQRYRPCFRVYNKCVNLPFRLKNIDSCEQPFTKSENTLHSQFPICLIMISHLINPSQITFFFVNKDKRILILRMYTNFIIFTQ